MDFFKDPKEEVLFGVEGSIEWIKSQEKKELSTPKKHFKRFGKKRPVEKFIAKKVNWREDL